MTNRQARARLTDLFRRVGGTEPAAAQVYALVQQFLLPGCPDSCPDCLDNPSRYSDVGRPSRSLARLWLGLAVPEVDVDDSPGDWRERAVSALRGQGRVCLVAATEGLGRVAAALPDLLAHEVEVDYLLLPVAVRRVDRQGDRWRVTLGLSGGAHG